MKIINKFKYFCLLNLVLGNYFLTTSVSLAEEKKDLIKKPKSGLEFFEKALFNYKNSNLNSKAAFFEGDFKNKEVIDITNEDKKDSELETSSKKEKQIVDSENLTVDKNIAENVKENLSSVVFDSDSPDKKVISPDEDPKIAINKDASGPAIGMVAAWQDGDKETASKYASQWVRYQQNFFFLVRDITQLVGEALVKQGEIDEDQWVGVNQYIDYEFAKTRNEMGALFKPKHEHAMKRIKPDSKGEAEIYFFFTLNCSWCRKMAPDIERLWKSVQSDNKVKMVALTMGPTPKSWIAEYRKYTGLTIPILEGEKVAKKLGVKFVPAVVIVAPTENRAYLKTGEQNFSRLYEFTRRVQGLPSNLGPELEQIINAPIGESEQLQITQAKKDFQNKKVDNVVSTVSGLSNTNENQLRLNKF